MLDHCPAASTARRAGGSNGYRWITGPIATVHNEHFCSELAAVARVGLVARRWFSDKNRSAAVVLGNHPISVSHALSNGVYCLRLLPSLKQRNSQPAPWPSVIPIDSFSTG